VVRPALPHRQDPQLARAPGGIYRVRTTGPKPGGKRADPARIPVGLSVELLQKWLPDPAASRALARLAEPKAAPALVEVLKSGDAAQRLAAAEGLAACGTAESLPAIWDALAGEPDKFLEHALVHAAWRIADPKALQAALTQAHPRVQKAALVLLPQKSELNRPAVLEKAGAAGSALRQAAPRGPRKRPAWALGRAPRRPLAGPGVAGGGGRPRPVLDSRVPDRRPDPGSGRIGAR
jgi:hypothetical protein